jgi:hypothetical protein
METFELGRLLHSTVGAVALIAFWIAALASKGGEVHRRAGKVYLSALLGVLALSTLMVAGRALMGDPGLAIFLAFLISLVGTASWLMWFAIRRKHDAAGFTGPVYRTLASWLMLAGAAMLVLAIVRGRPLMILLSLLGIGFGVNMWRLALASARDARWWLGQHLNGVMLNFIATHDSFTALGIGSVVPELRTGVPRMLIATGLIVIGIALRVYFGRRYAVAPVATRAIARSDARPARP